VAKNTRKLDFEPISTEAYLDALIGLTDADKKALTERYRQSRAYELPEALRPAENALRGVFGGLIDLARSLSAKQIVPYTTDEQIAAEAQMAARWNALAEQYGVPLRLEQWGTASKGGLRFRELEPDAGLKAIEVLMPSVTPDKWMSDLFILITLWMGSEPVHPAMFEAQARRHWEERLRQRVAGRALADLADSRDRAIGLADNQRKEHARDIKRRAERLDVHLAAHKVDAFVPPNWPTKDGVTPISNPHEARNEIVVDPKTGNKTALFVETAVQRETWRHRGWWGFLEWPAHHPDRTAALRLLYLNRRKLLPTPWLQRLLKRWRRLKIECGENSNFPSNPSPFPGKRRPALSAGAADYLEKHEDDGQQGTDDRNGQDLAGDV
jgi:hypothetical protein